MNAVPGHRVHLRRLSQRVPEETHRVETMVISQDKDDVAWFGAGDLFRYDLRRDRHDRAGKRGDEKQKANKVSTHG